MDAMDFMDEELMPKDECKCCGETKYQLRDGYYYCLECGTRAEHVEVQVECTDDYETRRFATTKKLPKLAKLGQFDITSWECYNYMLHGMVNELINAGAKDDLKLITLQLWAAYLRRMEVAFFSTKRAALPRLGVRYQQKDAEILYNHKKIVKKRIRKSSGNENSARRHRKNVRKLDESVYSANSQTEASMASSFFSSGISTSTGNTNRAIKLEFTSRANKHYKKKMGKLHFKKHLTDSEGVLKCHSKSIKARELERNTRIMHTLNIKQLYAILGIALNLIEDDIQLCDLLRFISEDYITSKKAVHYFPENLHEKIDVILNSIGFHSFPEKFNYNLLRDHINEFGKFINIRSFKTPNITSLVRRYATELNLPKCVTLMVTRLINLLPPEKCSRHDNMYGAFEARAMAYIIFVLKLIFGLDGEKEKIISQSAQKVNQQLQSLSLNHPQLFIWSEWVEYIEMRKVLLSQHDLYFSEQFKQSVTITQSMKYLENYNLLDENLEFIEKSNANAKLQAMANCLGQKLTKDCSDNSDIVAVHRMPSLTPAHTYLKRLFHQLELKGSSSSIPNSIPAYMHKDHTESSIEPFLCEKSLRKHLKQHGIQLSVEPLNCISNREFIGIFSKKMKYLGKLTETLKVYKADFNVTEEEWKNTLSSKCENNESLEFQTEFSKYNRTYMYRLKKKYNFPENKKSISFKSTTSGVNKYQPSIDVFNESDMNPLNNPALDKPRENLECVNIFSNDSENDSDDKAEQEETNEKYKQENPSALILHTSSMDCWQLLGLTTLMSEVQKNELASKFPHSFFWLLKTCAQTIGVEWIIVYEELMILETMFGFGLENLKDFTDCLRYRYNLPIKEYNVLLNQYRTRW